MPRMVAMLTLTGALLVAGNPALALPRTEPCAEVSIEYNPKVVEPRDIMSYTQDIFNCSTTTEVLQIATRTIGPCGYDQTTTYQETLGPGMGMSVHADGFAPRCVGRWRTAIVVALADTHQILDRDRAGFEVVEPIDVGAA